MIVRSNTDLPLPEPPTTPSTSPRLTSRSIPSWMVTAPKRVTTPRTRIAMSSGSSGTCQIRSSENMIEKAASATITMKMDSTTDWVVSRPTLSALRSTLNPS